MSPRLRECHALAGELGALRPIETTGFAVAADGPRTVADARGLACKVSPGGSVQCVGKQVVRTGERAGTPEVCLAEKVGFLLRTRVFTPIFDANRAKSLELKALASSSSCADCRLLALVFVLYQRDVTHNVTRSKALRGRTLKI